MLKCGQTKIPIPYRTCSYCKHENGRLTNFDMNKAQYCTLKHKNLNHWVSAQQGKSCCGWEPAEDGYKRLARDRLAGRADKLRNYSIITALCSHPDDQSSLGAKSNQQHFSWISFMEHRPCTVDT